MSPDTLWHDLFLIDKRFAERITRDPKSGCWQWRGTDVDTYGQISYQGRQCVTHRILYELLCGWFHEKWVIDHWCMNKGCCNPCHLEPVPPHVNVARGGRKGNKIGGQEWSKETRNRFLANQKPYHERFGHGNKNHASPTLDDLFY